MIGIENIKGTDI